MRIKLEIPLSLSEIATAVGGDLKCADARVDHVTTDSREVECGDLFIALCGSNNDGNLYAGEAVSRGGYVLGSRCASIYTSDARALIPALVKEYKRRLPCLLYTVAITGSVGKTTTKELVKIILSGKFKVHANLGNYNNELGMLHTVLSARRDTEVLVVEMGMNHKGEISRLSRAVEPDIALITNVGTAHVGNLGSRENIAKAKLEISDGISGGALIVPDDEPLLNGGYPKYRVSTARTDCDSCLTIISVGDEETTFSFTGRHLQLNDQTVRLVGTHLMTSLAFALSAADIIGVDDGAVRSSIRLIDSSCLRQKRLKIGRYEIYDDTYSSSPEAAIAVMEAMTRSGYQVSAVLGDMLELGVQSNKLHRRVGEAAAGCGIKKLYLFGKYATETADGALASGMPRESVFINAEMENYKATADQIRNSYDGELLIVKASHDIHAERIFEFLKD